MGMELGLKVSDALCWIHAERSINKLIAPTQEKRKLLEDVKEQIWAFYEELNLGLKHIYKNKAELLLVLERPEIPLHNNLSETDIREYVKRRKVSGSTRSEMGRHCRDTFTSLKKTCRKLGISFWKYLLDRISKSNEIPPLPELIFHYANAP